MTVSIVSIYGVDSQVWEIPDVKMGAVISILNAVGVPIRRHKTDNDIEETWELD